MSEPAANNGGRNWRAVLTSNERKQIAGLDKSIAEAVDKLVLLRARRERIQNRASVRVGK